MTDIPVDGAVPDEGPQRTAPTYRTPRPPDTITPGMLDALRKTKPWVRFLGILGFVMVGLILLAAIGMLGVALFMGTTSGADGYMLAGLSVLYLAMAVLYIFPARYLYRYASAIETALKSPSKSLPIEQALQHQKSFWKFAGIITLVTILLYIPGIILAIAVPNLLTAMQRSKQKRTMADMRTIAAAVEARATDVNAYPETTNLDELAALLEPTYIKKMPRLDGWSNPIQYRAICNAGFCDNYVLASSGKDGKFTVDYVDAANAEPETTTNFDEDIIFSDGKFVRYPSGVSGT